MNTRMRGVKFLGNNELTVTDLDIPSLEADEVLVKVTASGLCGGELKALRKPEGHPTNNGHEVTGVVEDPNGHSQFAKGDRVGIFTIQGCGHCHWCKKGLDLFCSEVRAPSGGHAEYVVSRATSLVKLDDLGMELSDTLAVLLFGDGMGVPYGASTRAKVGPDDVTCIFGCGPVGLGMVIVQAYLGARVIAIDVNPVRLEFAKKLGAAETFVWNQDTLVEDLKKATDGIGPDKCFEAVGRQDTLDLALEATAPGGAIVLAGHGEQTMDPQKLIAFRNLTVMGNWVYHPGEYKKLLEMQKNGLGAERLVTATYPLSEAPRAYKEAADGTQAKIIFVNHGEA